VVFTVHPTAEVEIIASLLSQFRTDKVCHESKATEAVEMSLHQRVEARRRELCSGKQAVISCWFCYHPNGFRRRLA
jgi:hypothetical protein